MTLKTGFQRWAGKKKIGMSELLPAKNRVLHKQSSYNYDLLKETQHGRCFYCLAKFEFVDIEHWTDKSQTAICPKCGIDSVLPGSFEDEKLILMHHDWFCEAINLETDETIDICDCDRF